MKSDNLKLRRNLLDACRILDHHELVHGYGHVSARVVNSESMLINPGKAPGLLRSADDIVHVDFDGNLLTKTSTHRKRRGQKSLGFLHGVQPPLEFHLHSEIYRARSDVHAICRTHGKYAQVLSVLRRTIRPVHELATTIGSEIPLFDYPGVISSKVLGQEMVQALGNAKGLLMRGNGALITGATVEEAVVNAIYMETTAELQYLALAIGEPAWYEGDEKSGEFAYLAKKNYESVLRPWEYFLTKSKKSFTR
jgi:L-ribulose-5-phosphate 4-epimerase